MVAEHSPEASAALKTETNVAAAATKAVRARIERKLIKLGIPVQEAVQRVADLADTAASVALIEAGHGMPNCEVTIVRLGGTRSACTCSADQSLASINDRFEPNLCSDRADLFHAPVTWKHLFGNKHESDALQLSYLTRHRAPIAPQPRRKRAD